MVISDSFDFKVTPDRTHNKSSADTKRLSQYLKERAGREIDAKVIDVKEVGQNRKEVTLESKGIRFNAEVKGVALTKGDELNVKVVVGQDHFKLIFINKNSSAMMQPAKQNTLLLEMFRTTDKSFKQNFPKESVKDFHQFSKSSQTIIQTLMELYKNENVKENSSEKLKRELRSLVKGANIKSFVFTQENLEELLSHIKDTSSLNQNFTPVHLEPKEDNDMQQTSDEDDEHRTLMLILERDGIDEAFINIDVKNLGVASFLIRSNDNYRTVSIYAEFDSYEFARFAGKHLPFFKQELSSLHGVDIKSFFTTDNGEPLFAYDASRIENLDLHA